MILADRVTNIRSSATLAVSAKAQELKAQGRSILSLSVGEPDMSTPEFICEAAKIAIDARLTRYTPVPGRPSLRSAVAGYFERFYGVKVEKDNIIISNGGKHSLYSIFQALINPGEQVIIPAPYWVSFPPMVELAGGKPTIVYTTPEHDFKVTVDDLEQNFTPKTKVVVLNSPSNPTGAAYSQKEVDAIARWVVEKNIILLSDETYDRLVFSPNEPVSLSPWWEKHPENFVISGGLSKSFAMTGWRVGYTLACTGLVKAISRLQGQSTSNVCSIAQAAALAALSTEDFSTVEDMRKTFERRRDLVYGILSTWEGVICPKPQGAFYIFPDVSALFTPEYPDSASLCTTLLSEAGVAVVPGVAFGNDNCIRISFAVSDEVIVEALEKMRKVLYKQ